MKLLSQVELLLMHLFHRIWISLGRKKGRHPKFMLLLLLLFQLEQLSQEFIILLVQGHRLIQERGKLE